MQNVGVFPVEARPGRHSVVEHVVSVNLPVGCCSALRFILIGRVHFPVQRTHPHTLPITEFSLTNLLRDLLSPSQVSSPNRWANLQLVCLLTGPTP